MERGGGGAERGGRSAASGAAAAKGLGFASQGQRTMQRAAQGGAAVAGLPCRPEPTPDRMTRDGGPAGAPPGVS